MKLLAITFFLFFVCHSTFGQTNSPGAITTSEQTTWEKYNAKYNNPVYVIDEKPMNDSLSKKVLNGLDPYAITKIICVHNSSSGKRNVVYITTAILKIAGYQKKFSSFSTGYKNYLETHQNRDGRLFYILNNTPMSGDRRDITDELYNIPLDKIERVNFVSQKALTGNETLIVSITTK